MHTTSRPLCLAYKAVQLVASALADGFLYRLRYATIVEIRPTTHLEELLRVVRLRGVDEQAFLACYHGGRAEDALCTDLQMLQTWDIHTLPSYLLEYQGRKMLIRQLLDYDSFVAAIDRLTDGVVRPQVVERSVDAVRRLLEKHPLVSPIELREAFDLNTTDEVRILIQPLMEAKEIQIKIVPHGYFIIKKERTDK